MHRVQNVCSNLIIQGLIKVEVFIVKSLPQILIQNPPNFHLSKFQGFWPKRDTFGEKKFSEVFHPSIHRVVSVWASSGVACRSSRATEEEFAAGERAGERAD
jgi:hypothetical protein